jgi:hypothetical protein
MGARRGASMGQHSDHHRDENFLDENRVVANVENQQTQSSARTTTKNAFNPDVWKLVFND